MKKAKFLKFLLIYFAIFVFGTLDSEANEMFYGKVLKEIRITGAKRTDIDIITRELASQIGQPYLKVNADKDYARLDKLDIFSYVDIQVVTTDDGVALEIEVKEIFPYLPFFSYEVTDENGFAAGVGFQSVNMLRRDIFATGFARFGGATNIGVFLENPWIGGNHLSYTFEFFQRQRFNQLDQFNETSTEFNLTIGSYVGENGRIGGRLSFLSIKSDSSGRTLSSNNRDNLPTIGFFLGYDSRDLWSNPHTGWWNEIALSKSGGFLGSDGDFWSLDIDVRRYVPVIKRHTLALFSLMTLRMGTVGDEIPLHQDFHIGGTNSVRGWELDSRKGKNQFLNTAEYRVTLVEPRVLSLFGLTLDVGLQFALFGDLGLAWNKSSEFKKDNLIGGYGFGLRALVPFVNMFRFDAGFGEPGKSFKVHISPFEKPVAQRTRVR